MKTAICLYVRSEERDLPEWLAYHAALGFDSMLVYENLSDDGTWDVLQRARRVWDVRPMRWPVRSRLSQHLAYNHCLALRGLGFDWVLFIDSDEFFVPIHVDDAPSFLRPFDAATAVALNFAIYGSSGHVDLPEGLVTEAFTHRAESAFKPNRLVKCFVRPLRRYCRSPHHFPGLGACVDAGGAPIDWSRHPGQTAAPSHDIARVNHYFTRSRAHWAAKMARGYRDMTRSDGKFEAYDRNEVEDRCAARFAPRVRAELARYHAA